MSGLDLKSIFRETLRAISPIAEERKILIRLEKAEESVYTTLPMDEVLAPVFFLLIRLIYIMPAGRNLAIRIGTRQDGITGTDFLQIEIFLYWFTINPNILFRPDNNRFKIEFNDEHQTRIYIEWPVQDINKLRNEEEPRRLISPTGQSADLEIAGNVNATLLTDKEFHELTHSRWMEYGKSAYVRQKINGSKNLKEAAFLENVFECICKNISNPRFDTDGLCRQMGLSRAQFYRKIKGLTGFSTANYIRHIRLQRAAEMLVSSTLSIGEIAQAVGFNELSYLSSSFFEEFKVTPTEWRKARKMKQ